MQSTDSRKAKVLIYVKKDPVEVVNNPAGSFICYICVAYFFFLLSKKNSVSGKIRCYVKCALTWKIW